MIWKRHLTLDELNATSDNTMVAHLGIVYTRLGDDVLEAEMPVDTRTHQPFGPHISFNSARSSSLCSFGWAV